MKPSDRLARLVALESADIADQIRPILDSANPLARGAVLGDLVSEYFATHFHPLVREEQIALWLQTMQSMIPINELEAGDPWRTQRQ
jgi:hypothetical protein